MIREHAGWFGVFTTDQYPGAYPNGATIVKVMWEIGDAHPVGTLGTVLGSFGHPKIGVGYFIEWECRRRLAVFIAAKKIRLAHAVSPDVGRA